MKTTTESNQFTLKDRGSEFFGSLFPARNVKEFQDTLEAVKKEHFNASHHCYGYRIDVQNVHEYSSDDGEPSGSAGLPILNQIRSAELINCAIIVVRYFGGTKLGKSGLIEAYGGTASELIKKSKLKKVIPVKMIRIFYNYSEERVIQKLIDDHGLKVLQQEYLEKVELKLACRTDTFPRLHKTLHSIAHLGIDFEEVGETYLTL